MGPAPEPRKPKVMRVATRCRTVEELIAAFATLVDEHSLVVLTDQQRVIGSRQPFVVELSDGTFVMKGEAEVVESTPPPKGRLKLRFLALDAGGREVHQRMLERKGGTRATPPRAPTEPALKPLVRIPDPTPGASGPTAAPPPVPPVPKPVPIPPRTPTAPTPTLPRAPSAIPVPVIPPPRTATGTSPGASKTMIGIVPSVPRLPPVAGTGAKPAAPPPTPTPPASASENFDEQPTNVETPIPVPVPEPVVAPPPSRPVPASPRRAVSDTEPTPNKPAEAPPTIEAALTEATAKQRAASPLPEGERAPGSPYVLPANPFGEVAPESLEAFVECTLYEETGQFSFGEGGWVNDLRAPNDLEPPGEPPPPFPVFGAPEPAAPPPPPTPPPAPPPAPPAPAPTPAPAPLPEVASDPAFPPFDAPAPAPVAIAPPVTPVPVVATPAAKKPIPWKWIGIGGAGLAAIAVIALLAAGGNSSSAPAKGSGTGSVAAKDPPKHAPDAGADRAVTPDAAVAPEVVADAGADVDPDVDPDEVTGPVVAPTGDCHLKVAVEPDGAHIKLNGELIGDAPLDTSIPCGPQKLTIFRSHYETVFRSIKGEPGKDVTIDLKMVRPTYRITITSKPKGATISINGRTVGKAPVTTTVKGYTALEIEASLKGFQSWKKTTEAEKGTRSIVATLKKSR